MPPLVYTLESFKAAMLQHKPELAKALEFLMTSLTSAGSDPRSRQSDLATFLGREVRLENGAGTLTFRWHNQVGREVVLTIPDPAREPAVEPTPPQAHTRNPGIFEAPQTPEGSSAILIPTAADTTLAAAEDAADILPAGSPVSTGEGPGNPNDGPPAEHGASSFRELARLLDDATLLVTIARTGTREGEPVLTVNVIPKAIKEADKELMHPMSLSGTPGELDDPLEGFAKAIQVAVEGNAGIREGIAELEAAKKAEAEAKKEAAKVKRQAARKNTSDSKETAKTEKPEKNNTPLFDKDQGTDERNRIDEESPL